MTPPRMPPPRDADMQYLRYAVALLSALAAEDGARERAAARLGIPVRTLTRHLDQLGLGKLCASEGESAIWPRSVRQPPLADASGMSAAGAILEIASQIETDNSVDVDEG